jgi:NAD(P)-dependent dehydrogenase (short-subunit alcohol dehydrogenase family)
MKENHMALTNFTGAVAVITGGASGIGLATARALRAKGAHLILADINSQGLQQVTQDICQLNAETNACILGVPTDVTNELQVQALMRQAVAMCGRIDLVVTSAGSGRGGPIDTFSSSDMRALLETNFMGTFLCVQAALPTMRQQHSGHFVFLSSVAGKLCTPMISGYCASKWAVRGFSSALRAELYGTGIGITTVYPAWVDTPMVSREAEALRWINVQVMLTADQVANEILQAVTEDRRDLTLAPNPDIALALQIMKEDPDKAEMLVGEAFHQRLEQLSAQQQS